MMILSMLKLQTVSTNMSHLAKEMSVPADTSLELAGISKIAFRSYRSPRRHHSDLEAFVRH